MWIFKRHYKFHLPKMSGFKRWARIETPVYYHVCFFHIFPLPSRGFLLMGMAKEVPRPLRLFCNHDWAFSSPPIKEDVFVQWSPSSFSNLQAHFLFLTNSSPDPEQTPTLIPGSNLFLKVKSSVLYKAPRAGYFHQPPSYRQQWCPGLIPMSHLRPEIYAVSLNVPSARCGVDQRHISWLSKASTLLLRYHWALP